MVGRLHVDEGRLRVSVTFEVVRNEGQFGIGRMDWCLTVNGRLVSHCGLRFVLEDQLMRLEREAWLVLHACDSFPERVPPVPRVPALLNAL